MHTFIVLFRTALASLLLATSAAVASSEVNWPVLPKLNELPTPYGTLSVGASEYVYEARLQLDGILVEPLVSGMLNISYAFNMPQAQAALVVINKGYDACPVTYRWVVLNASSYRVSPEFGSCSENIRVSADSRRLTVQTPSREKPGALDVYVYDGKTVKHRISDRK